MDETPGPADTASAHERRRPVGRYVVGVDGSDESVNALRHAIRLALLTGASIDAVAVWDDPFTNGPEHPFGDWDLESESRASLSEAVRKTIGADLPSFLNLVVLNGNIANVLIDQSQHADLLIVGSRGHGGFAGMLIGSVSSTCAEHASCPVLIVHGTRASLPDPAARLGLDL